MRLVDSIVILMLYDVVCGVGIPDCMEELWLVMFSVLWQRPQEGNLIKGENISV